MRSGAFESTQCYGVGRANAIGRDGFCTVLDEHERVGKDTDLFKEGLSIVLCCGANQLRGQWLDRTCAVQENGIGVALPGLHSRIR